MDGTARGWAGVWGLIYLDLCATSGCLGACHSGACAVLLASAKSPFLGSGHSPKDWCRWGGGHDSGLGPTRRRSPPSSMPQVLRMWSLGDGPQVSVSCHQGLQPPVPDSPSSCPFQIPCPSSGAAASHGGCASHVQDAQQRAKSSEVERVHLFLDLTVFF